MKFFLVLLFACIVMISPAMAATQTATITIYPGENWVAAPLMPVDSDPTSVFAPCINVCSLKRFDAGKQKEITYSSAESTAFGDILLGDGYKIFNPTSTTYYCSYEGLPDGVPYTDPISGKTTMTDMWINLPGNQTDQSGGGLHWMGYPYNHTQSVSSIFVSDRNSIKTLAQAVDYGWIDGTFPTFDSATKRSFSAGLSSAGAEDGMLRPGYMYSVTSHEDNLIFIIKADAASVPEPSSLVAMASAIIFICIRKRR